ncbi:MAG TPA: FxsA family protein [Solirubrobacterales bacterium]|nr:FxsA family protein [Solirubrobacterales bacterium]
MLFLVVIFILVPIAELYVIIQVGNVIGLGPTLFLLLADAVLGSLLWRHQGRAAWVRFNRALAEGRVPHKEVFDGVLVILGGALLITPGFLTDILGLILLIPPTRAVVRAMSARFVRRRIALGEAVWTFGTPRRGPSPRPAPNGPAGTRRGPGPDDLFSWEEPPASPRQSGSHPDDIEGTGHEIRDEDELPPGREPFGG